MPDDMKQIALPLMVRALGSAERLLTIAAVYSQERNISEDQLLQYRLAADMLPLAAQPAMLSDGLRGAVAQMAGDTDHPTAHLVFNRGKDADFAPFDTVFSVSLDRLRVATADLDAATSKPWCVADAQIELIRPTHLRRFTARAFLFDYVVPNVFFHATMIHALLRASGVPVGKGDFEAPRPYEWVDL